MSSTNKTANYNLNQYIGTDIQRRTDYNSDMLNIDTALKGLEDNKAVKGTAYSNLENNVKIVQGVPAGGKMYLGAGVQTGAIKIKLPSTKEGTMFKFKIRIKGYSQSSKQSNTEYIVKGINNSGGFGMTSEVAASCQVTTVKDNLSAMSPTFYFCTGATEDYILIGEITDVHSYKTVVIDDVEKHLGNSALDWAKDWSISIVTTLETLTSQYKVAVIPSLNATHLNGVQETTTGEANKIVKTDNSGNVVGKIKTLLETAYTSLTRKTKYYETSINQYINTGATTGTYGTAYDTGIALDDNNFRVVFEGSMQGDNTGATQNLSSSSIEVTKTNNEVTFDGYYIKFENINSTLQISTKHSSINGVRSLLIVGKLKVFAVSGIGTLDGYYIESKSLSKFAKLLTDLIIATKAVVKSTDTTALDVQNASGISVFTVDTTNQVVTGSAVDTAKTANKLVKRDGTGDIAGVPNLSLITAQNDFIVGSGVGAVAKKTLAETKSILGIDKVSNVSADTAQTASKIVQRDASGNIAGTINLNGTLINVLASPNLNTLLSTGLYYCTTPSNSPTAKNGYCNVYAYMSGYVLQEYYNFDNSERYTRVYNNNTWSSWKRVFQDEGTNLVANGYTKLSNGLIMQWGTIGATAQYTGASVTFPIAFPTACLNVVLSCYESGADRYNGYSGQVYPAAVTKTGFTAVNGVSQNNIEMMYMAIGY